MEAVIKSAATSGSRGPQVLEKIRKSDRENVFLHISTGVPMMQVATKEELAMQCWRRLGSQNSEKSVHFRGRYPKITQLHFL